MKSIGVKMAKMMMTSTEKKVNTSRKKMDRMMRVRRMERMGTMIVQSAVGPDPSFSTI